MGGLCSFLPTTSRFSWFLSPSGGKASMLRLAAEDIRGPLDLLRDHRDLRRRDVIAPGRNVHQMEADRVVRFVRAYVGYGQGHLPARSHRGVAEGPGASVRGV